MFDYFDRQEETTESKHLTRPKELTEAEQAALDDRHKADGVEKETLKAAKRDMVDNEEEAYLRQTVYDSVYQADRDETEMR
ncbi:hypothetical protein QJ043_08255 [Olsenella sp. YH-ols2217]|uniref:Uncharacterized protein n=1 Tax=Kribbibacterium absianum TaxID=3044210 RepID=A0ABT6ZLZ1_9ACTN|nr:MULTISPECIES: hypothetical protein [unclassified Olsenella]MDJ1122058.1 hypothetical protein [Olsenella sp. YH-ols2216]MDJ1130066.1 hypothetical protein [Olsenella sp. YH-ols2217]